MQLGLGVNLFNRQKEEGLPVRDGLVAEYRFDEGRGQVLCDYSGNGNHGQLGSTREADTNDPLWTPQGLEFDGVDDYVDCGNPESLRINGDLTIQVVAHIPEAIVGTRFFISKFYAGEYELGYKEPDALAFRHKSGTSAENINYSGFFTLLNAYYDVAIVRDINSMSLTAYKNGGLFSTQSINYIPLVTQYPVFIGSRSPLGGQYMVGDICYVLVYNRCLSSGEISQNHQYLQAELAKRGVILA